MDRDTDDAAIVGNRTSHCLPDPPRGVRAELEAAPPVELLDGAKEAEVTFLDQVDQGHPAVGVASRDAHHQAQVCGAQVIPSPLTLLHHAFQLFALAAVEL